MKLTIPNTKIRFLLFFIACALIVFNCVLAQASDGRQHHRTYPVGFKTLHVKNGNHNTVMNIWYPSAKNVKPSFFTMESYLYSFRHLMRFNDSPDSVRKTIQTLLEEYGVDYGSMEVSMKKMNTYGDTIYPNAKPFRQSFPLVIINSALNNEAIFHTHMAHSLAGRGYVVVSLGSGAGTGGTTLGYDTTAVKWQIKDIEVALKEVIRRMKNAIDTQKIALISWSTGGIAAWRFAENNRKLKVMISLDAAMGYAYGLDIYRQLSKTTIVFDPDIQVLHFKARKGSVQQDLSIFQSLGKNQFELVDVPELNHYHFTSLANLMNQSHNNNTTFTNAYTNMLQKVYLFLSTNL